MNSEQELSKAEFAEMVKYIHRYVETSMDQWELWSFDSSRGKTFVKVALKSDGSESSYHDLNEYLSK